MSYRTLIAALLFIPLSGCTVYGDGYDRGYRGHHHSHHYYDGYRRDYSPQVYVTPRYYHYDDRRYDRHRHDSKRYVPAPPPRHHYGHDHRYRDGHKYHQPPRHDYRCDQRRQEHRNQQTQRSWGTRRSTQLQFSNGRANERQQRSGERRW